MKKLLPATLALLILICSCSSNKSFMHQRYTHFKHSKNSTVTESNAYAKKNTKTTVTAPETVVVTNNEVTKETVTEPALMSPAPAKADKLKYTRSAINKVIVPVALKGKEKIAGLVSSNSKAPVVKHSTVKPLNLDQQQAKRGLLWGVIDGILAIILLAAFIALIVWLVLVLT